MITMAVQLHLARRVAVQTAYHAACLLVTWQALLCAGAAPATRVAHPLKPPMRACFPTPPATVFGWQSAGGAGRRSHIRQPAGRHGRSAGQWRRAEPVRAGRGAAAATAWRAGGLALLAPHCSALWPPFIAAPCHAGAWLLFHQVICAGLPLDTSSFSPWPQVPLAVCLHWLDCAARRRQQHQRPGVGAGLLVCGHARSLPGKCQL